MANEWIDSPYGRFSSDFCFDLLSNLCDANAGIQTGPFGTQLHHEDYVQIGTPIITVEHLDENRILHANTPKVTSSDSNRLSRYRLNRGDIVFSRVGSVDRRALVREEEVGWLFSGRCLRIRPDPKKIDSKYLSYFFGLSAFKQHIRSIAVGATMPSLNTSLLSEIKIPYPPEIADQRAIAHILGTLDDKIELNRRQNATLEAMAQALFKAWFVDFEPVRAKMDGRWKRGQSLPGLPAHLYDLFPDHLVESELGEIPQGWRISTIGEEVTVCGGSTPSTKQPEYWESGQHHWATPKDLSALKFPVLLETDRKISDAGLAKISSGLLPVGTVLLSSRAPIGYLAITEIPTAINQGFIAIQCDGALPNVFVLPWCRENMNAIIGNANGSTFQEISKSNFKPLHVIVPSDPVLTHFTRSANVFYRQMADNEREARSLARLRDTLLPKLIKNPIQQIV